MELRIHYTALPEGMDGRALQLELAGLLEEDGWPVGSGPETDGGWLDLELEDERVDPKYGILAVKHYLQRRGFSRDTTIELAGTPTGIYE